MLPALAVKACRLLLGQVVPPGSHACLGVRPGLAHPVQDAAYIGYLFTVIAGRHPLVVDAVGQSALVACCEILPSLEGRQQLLLGDFPLKLSLVLRLFKKSIPALHSHLLPAVIPVGPGLKGGRKIGQDWRQQKGRQYQDKDRPGLQKPFDLRCKYSHITHSPFRLYAPGERARDTGPPAGAP